MIDREKIHRRVIDKINYGYSTHRVLNKILEEVTLELADALIEEIENEGPRASKTVHKQK